MSANTLAKIAAGISDNLLTCIARAWWFDEPLRALKFGFFAPAMNTAMWKNPLTSSQITTLCHTLNWHLIEPISKVLMCGETGQGAMEEPKQIIKIVKSILS